MTSVMMIDSSLPVFDMNTKAVVCLKEGRIQPGKEGLRETLVQTRTLLLAQQEDGVDAAATSNSCPKEITEGPLLSVFSVPLVTPTGDKDAAHCPLFARAFVVGGDDSDSWRTDVHCQHVTLGVLLYNLALSHHLSGLHKGATAASQEEYLVALNLYQLALSLVETSIQSHENDKEQPLQEECQNLVVLLCAIFNNMANIHSRHFRVQETRNCLECLKEIVSNPYYGTEEEEEDHFFFYLNLFVTAPTQDFAIAPAA